MGNRHLTKTIEIENIELKKRVEELEMKNDELTTWIYKTASMTPSKDEKFAYMNVIRKIEGEYDAKKN
jgi:hypothetical protein